MIGSKDNPKLKRWAALCRDGRLRRSERRAIIEGPHLVSAFLASGRKPICVMLREGSEEQPEIKALSGKAESFVVSEKLFNRMLEAETPQGVAAEIEIPSPKASSSGDCVFLEGIQDAGNVGAIIRSAAAFGIGTVVLDQACADPWSPKVLRAGMGGHFALSISTVPSLASELERFAGKLVATVARGGIPLREADLSGRLGWIFGSEGRGLAPDTLREADLKVRIQVSKDIESLNVAAAAAVCFYEMRRKNGV